MDLFDYGHILVQFSTGKNKNYNDELKSGTAN